MKLKELELEGQTFDVEVSVRDGRFTIVEQRDGGKAICSSMKLEDAERDAARRLKGRRVHVNVPFIDMRTGVAGEAYSVHAGNGNVMALFEGERGEYHGGRGMGCSVLDPEMPAAKLERYRAIIAEQDKLEEERRAVEREYQVDLKKRVWEALREANETEGLESSLAM